MPKRIGTPIEDFIRGSLERFDRYWNNRNQRQNDRFFPDLSLFVVYEFTDPFNRQQQLQIR